MKKITMIALAMFTAVGAGAQTIYDATNIAQKELNGTARFVGMGGAMGALGGDISTIGTNAYLWLFNDGHRKQLCR